MMGHRQFGRYLAEYQNRKSLKVITGSGQSRARNAGLEVAQGSIFILDSDDYIKTNALEVYIQ